MGHKIVDVDAHVAEPITLIMDEYLDPEFRNRPMRLPLDDKGLEYLEVNGEKSASIHGGLGLGLEAGKGFGEKDLSEFYVPGKVHYYDGMIPASNDPHARIEWMNEEEVDQTLLYPTVGLFWEDDCEDAKVAGAYCRAYNDWLLDFCRPYPDRLIPIAHIPTIEAQEAVKEVRRTARLGAKGFMVNGLPTNGRLYGDPYFDPLYAEVEELGLPLAVHPTTHKDYIGKDVYSHADDQSMSQYHDFWYFVVADTFPSQIQLLNMINRGAFDRFPQLKVVYLETGATWIIYLLERMDDKWETERYNCRFELRPSEYFARQCWISFEPDEVLISHVMREVGTDKFFWATDFPHSDGFPGIVERIKKSINSLPVKDQQKILGGNAEKVYNLPN